MEIVFYTKSNCPLCEEAREVLAEAAARARAAFAERDILDDEGLFALYRYRVPVLTVGGTEILYGHFPVAAVERALGLRARLPVVLVGQVDAGVAAALAAAGYAVVAAGARAAVVGAGGRSPQGMPWVAGGDPADVVARLAEALAGGIRD